MEKQKCVTYLATSVSTSSTQFHTVGLKWRNWISGNIHKQCTIGHCYCAHVITADIVKDAVLKLKAQRFNYLTVIKKDLFRQR